MEDPPYIRVDLESTGSTSDEAKRLAPDHPETVVLVTAQEQTGGRGSHGRSWRSPRGGAWFSLAVPLAQHNPAISVVVGQAVLSVLENHTDGLALRKPNDILHEDKKLAGILCEQTLTPSQPQTTAIVGVGINANFPAAELGTDLRTPPTSLLNILGRKVEVAELISACAQAILDRLTP